MEIDTDGRGQVLAYGIKEPIKKGLTQKATISEVHKQGGVAIIAHPFDIIRGMQEIKMNYKYADGLETLNFGAVCNTKAAKFAKYNGVKVCTAGSDAHTYLLLDSALLQISKKCDTLDEFINILKAGDFVIFRNKNQIWALIVGGLNVFVTRLLWLLGVVKPRTAT